MRLVNLEYAGDECERVKVVVAHNKHKNEVKFKIVFNFHTEKLEEIKIYKAPRLRDIKDVLVKALYQFDWHNFTKDTEITTDSDKLNPIVEQIRDYAYYSALETKKLKDMAKIKTDWTRIVFRTFKSGVAKGEVIALMIDDEWSRGQVASYMHIGQHSGADYNGIIAVTRRATPEEVAPLADELHRIGYSNIEVMYRRGRKRKVA